VKHPPAGDFMTAPAQRVNVVCRFDEIGLDDVPSHEAGARGNGPGEVEQGIDSISLNPEAVVRTTLKVLETEEALAVMAQSGAGIERSDVSSSRGRD
jgi:hypothetical protein